MAAGVSAPFTTSQPGPASVLGRAARRPASQGLAPSLAPGRVRRGGAAYDVLTRACVSSRRLRVVASSAAFPPAPGSRVGAPPQPYAEGELDVPAWVGPSPLSWLINLLIHGPVYPLLRLNARSTLIKGAEKQGIPWRAIAQELEEAQQTLEGEKEALETQGIVYPSYYLQPFHAYPQGNLCWDAAREVEAATMRIYSRAILWAEGLLEAEHAFRQSWLDKLQAHHEAHSGGLEVDSILDLGCSTGVSTRRLARAFPAALVTGFDASPHFLSVAAFRNRQMQEFSVRRRAGSLGGGEGSASVTRHGAVVDAALALRPNPVTLAAQGVEEDEEEEARVPQRIRLIHGLAEHTGLPPESFAIVSIAFVFHECPAEAIRDLLSEARRLLRPGGTVVITDNSPKSKVIQSIPAPVATLLKTTEPHSDSYYLVDLPGVLQELGFLHINTVLSDPRHRVVTATAPKPS